MTQILVSHVHRVELFGRASVFATLPAVIIDHMAKSSRECSFKKNDLIIREGDIADCIYLIAKGEVSITKKTPADEIELAKLGAGEVFGEMGLLSADSVRTASVLAGSECILLQLSRSDFELLLQEFHYLKKSFTKIAETNEFAGALKRHAYFAAIDTSTLRLLAKRLQTLVVDPGTVVIHQNEMGESCYYLKSGEVEVTRAGTDGKIEKLATLHAGDIFGEASVLTDLPRNATVTATAQTKLLVIPKQDLVRIMEENRHVSKNVVNLLFLRSQPHKVEGVHVNATFVAGGEKEYEMLNPLTKSKLTLHEEEVFVWEQIDGQKNLKDLTLAFHNRFNVFSPQRVSGILSELIATGMAATDKNLAQQGGGQIQAQDGWWQKKWRRFKEIMEWKFIIYDVDQRLAESYNKFFHIVFTAPVQLMLIVVAILGFIVFLIHSHYFSSITQDASSPVLLFLILFPASFLAAFVHEAAHAFTMKAFGRSVLGIGLGWHWLGPAIFVDTSDMWLADKWQRVAVRLSGLYANVILSGMSALFLLLPLPSALAHALWFFSLSSYILVLVYLNPFIKSYGYLAKKELAQKSSS